MGFWDSLKDVGMVTTAPFTGGLSLGGAGEDTLARIPLVGGMMGAKTDEQKALLKKQEEMAADAKKRQELNHKMRMQALGQSMLAFNPQNQMMAQMFGPEAAFSPQQMAQMGSDPGAMSSADALKQWDAAAMQNPIQNGSRTGGPIPPEVQANLDRALANEKRKRMIEAQTTPLGPGPAPLRLPPPAPARRY